mmetsp:Transcript_9947/g.15956  ORF Transcript_9947/g.15956 Transcript_9947/m.15956 type:complete len:264 (+) Transcript_9947:285-1076(+)
MLFAISLRLFVRSHGLCSNIRPFNHTTRILTNARPFGMACQIIPSSTVPDVGFRAILVMTNPMAPIIRLSWIPIGKGHFAFIIPLLEWARQSNVATVATPIAGIIALVFSWRMHQCQIARMIGSQCLRVTEDGGGTAKVTQTVPRTTIVGIMCHRALRRIHSNEAPSSIPPMQPIRIVVWRRNGLTPIMVSVARPPPTVSTRARSQSSAVAVRSVPNVDRIEMLVIVVAQREQLRLVALIHDLDDEGLRRALENVYRDILVDL